MRRICTHRQLLKELQKNEGRYAAGEELRPLLVRNKALLAQALAALPVAGNIYMLAQLYGIAVQRVSAAIFVSTEGSPMVETVT